MARVAATILSLGLLAASSAPLAAAPTDTRPLGAATHLDAITRDPATGRETFPLAGGASVVIGSDGLGMQVGKDGQPLRPIAIVRTGGALPALGQQSSPSDLAVAHRLARSRPGLFAKGEVVVVFRNAIDLAGLQTAIAHRTPITSTQTGDPQLATTLAGLRPKALRPLFGKLSPSQVGQLGAAARSQLGSGALDLTRAYVITIGADEPQSAALRLRALSNVAYAEPNFYVDPMTTDPKPLPDWVSEAAEASSFRLQMRHFGASNQHVTGNALPTNFGLVSSEQSYLNANSVNAVEAWEVLAKYGQIPGQGEIVTNVSVGDLTDEGMAKAGDQYVQIYGPTTIVRGGQRYLDFPTLPLIPTYTADDSGLLNPLGSAEVGDPNLSEILLDFSVMAPLPDNLQRPGHRGKGTTDLLGIAPGAQYRLVAPQQPTFSNIDSALVAAAAQSPHPNVITASLGYGTDSIGFPGRYLEDDPLTQAVVAAIVNSYHIVVCISSNDGTRIFTNAAVNPDGGSTPTDLAMPGTTPTDIEDDQFSTTPTLVPDTGAIAAGGSTLDDVIAAPPQGGGPLATQNAFAETRTNGGMDFSSGFGTRVNVSAPSDNIASLYHVCKANPCSPTTVIPVLNGGTSASSPEVAAAAAVALQAARLAGKSLSPAQVRQLLIQTARNLPQVPQIDRDLHVGPQLDVSAAVARALGPATGAPGVARVAVAERQNIGNLSGTFIEQTDPTNIELSGPKVFGMKSGQNVVDPITVAPDWINVPSNAHFDLFVSGNPKASLAKTKWARLLPTQILSAAGLSLVSTTPRTVSLTYRATMGAHLLAATTFALTFGPTNGTYIEALAPLAPAVVKAGASVTVSYDLSSVRGVSSPFIYVSSIGHWSFASAPFFRISWSAPLTAPKGTITIPESAFVGGGGIYGVGLIQSKAPSGQLIGGEVAPIRVEGASAARPAAPTLSAGQRDLGGHGLVVTRAASQFTLHYDVDNVKGASNALLEISSAGPAVTNLWNVFTNAFGTMRDKNGVDTTSTVYQPLFGKRGSAKFDALTLGLASSMFYTLRVLPAQGTTVVGQASPVSSVQFDDGVAPGGADLTSFDILPGGKSTVATLTQNANAFITDSTVYRYDPAAGSYGTVLADDPNGTSQFYLFGADPQKTAVVRTPLDPTAPKNIVTFDNTTDNFLNQVNVAAKLDILSGKTDPVRHRMAFVFIDNSNFSFEVRAFELGSQKLGSPIVVGEGYRFPNMLDIDTSNGTAFVSGRALECGPPFSSGVQALNLDAGTASATTSLPTCEAGIASDQAGGNIYFPHGGLINPFGPPFPSGLVTVSESTLQQTGSVTFKDRAGYYPAYDAVHKLLVIGYIAPSDYFVNNSATSVVGVYDMTTGRLVKRITAVDFVYPVATDIPYLDGGIQLDPTTRTGWTYGPLGTELQQFNY